jgi:putative peptidoglycan binding protein
MKWLSTAAFLAVAYLPVFAAHSSAQSHEPPASAKTSSHSTNRTSRVRRAATGSAERTHPALQAASYRSGGSQTASPSRKSSKNRVSKKRQVAHRRPLQLAPTPERVSEIQSALARGGYYKDDPNGKWDSDTTDALQRFQSSNGLDTTGKLDALTLQKLGLGSDIAGVSAPKGIVSHSCCSLSPSPSQAPSRSGGSPTSGTSNYTTVLKGSSSALDGSSPGPGSGPVTH